MLTKMLLRCILVNHFNTRSSNNTNETGNNNVDDIDRYHQRYDLQQRQAVGSIQDRVISKTK